MPRAFIVAWLLAIFVGLTGPNGNTIYVKADGVGIILTIPGVSPGAPTAVVTGTGIVYVQESPEVVKAKVEGAKEAVKPIGHDN
jgi:hypothetical protein